MNADNCNLLISNNKLTGRETIYSAAVMMKMVVQALSMSVIPFMAGLDTLSLVFKCLTYTSYCLVILSFFMEPILTKRETVLIIVIVTITAVGSFFSGNDILLIMLYVYGAKGLDLEKVFHKTGIIYIGLFIFIVVASLSGIIENWDFFHDATRSRWGLGYTYPTHTSSVMFMAVLSFCYIMKDRLSFFDVVILELLNLWIYHNTNSRAGFALVAVIPVVFYLIKYERNKGQCGFFYTIIQWSFPICTLLIFLMTVLYPNISMLQVVNNALSGRLFYSQRAIAHYGIHLFGQRINWVGFGGIGHTQGVIGGDYDYVDSSLLKIAIENGVLVWLVVICMWTATSINAVKTGNKYLVWAIAFIAAYGMVEQWTMNWGGNIFIMFLAYSIYPSGADENKPFYTLNKTSY